MFYEFSQVMNIILPSFNKVEVYKIKRFEVLNVKQRHFVIKVIVNFGFVMI